MPQLIEALSIGEMTPWFRNAPWRAPGYSWDRFNLRIADELIEYYLELEAGLA